MMSVVDKISNRMDSVILLAKEADAFRHSQNEELSRMTRKEKAQNNTSRYLRELLQAKGVDVYSPHGGSETPSGSPAKSPATSLSSTPLNGKVPLLVSVMESCDKGVKCKLDYPF